MSLIPEILIYIHYPYCELKCPYCDFNSHVADDKKESSHLDAYKLELDFFLQKINKVHSVRSIFFGGGTPSLMHPDTVFEILEYIKKHPLLKWCMPEITLEANPSSSEYSKFKDFKSAGINRLSIGVQSFNEKNLKFLGRKHNTAEAKNAIKMASDIFDEYSFDLIYCLPNQSLHEWQNELEFALEKYAKNHISAYTLTIEKGTPFFNMHAKNLFSLPPNEDDFYDLTNSLLAKHGFERYEISNYAKDQKHSLHNLGYWQSVDYMGIGAGAHGRITIDNKRFITQNFANPGKYLNSVFENNNALQVWQEMKSEDIIKETLLMNLRTAKGIDLHYFYQKYNFDLLNVINKKYLDELTQNGIIRLTNQNLAVEQKYLGILNSIILKLIR